MYVLRNWWQWWRCQELISVIGAAKRLGQVIHVKHGGNGHPLYFGSGYQLYFDRKLQCHLSARQALRVLNEYPTACAEDISMTDNLMTLLCFFIAAIALAFAVFKVVGCVEHQNDLDQQMVEHCLDTVGDISDCAHEIKDFYRS